MGRSAASATSRASDAPARFISRSFSAKPNCAKRHPIGAEGVGGQHVGAGVAIFGVDGSNQFGIGKAQLVEAAIGKDMMPVNFGAHGAVENQIALAEGLLESCCSRHLSRFYVENSSCNSQGSQIGDINDCGDYNPIRK